MTNEHTYPDNTVPNLDAMSRADLTAFWVRYQSVGKRADCAGLVGRRPRYTVLAADLGAYAINKATAMRCRERGDITAACVYETICDNIYETLPEDLRW